MMEINYDSTMISPRLFAVPQYTHLEFNDFNTSVLVLAIILIHMGLIVTIIMNLTVLH